MARKERKSPLIIKKKWCLLTANQGKVLSLWDNGAQKDKSSIKIKSGKDSSAGNGNMKSKFDGLCHKCNKQSHRRNDCKKLKTNCMKGSKTGKEVARTKMVFRVVVELVLMCITIPPEFNAIIKNVRDKSKNKCHKIHPSQEMRNQKITLKQEEPQTHYQHLKSI